MIKLLRWTVAFSTLIGACSFTTPGVTFHTVDAIQNGHQWQYLWDSKCELQSVEYLGPAVDRDDTDFPLETPCGVILSAPDPQMVGGPPTTTISEATNVLEQDTLQELDSVSPDGSIYFFDETTTELEDLEPGDVIVGGVSASSPFGFLREVVTVSEIAGQVAIETSQATLEDVFEEATIAFERTLSPSDVSSSSNLNGATLKMASPIQLEDEFVIELDNVVLLDVDGDSSTTSDRVTANGSIRISPKIELEGYIRGFRLQHLSFVATAIEELEIEIEGDVFAAGIRKNVEIARYVIAPFTVLVGPVPVVITPVLAFNVGLDGSVSVGIRSSVTQEASLSAGMIYENGDWRPISDLANAYQYDPPHVETECGLRVYAGPELEVMLYGVVVPQLRIHGYIDLLVDPLASPWWELFAGLEAEMGVEVQIFSKVIAGYHATLLDERTLLASSEGPSIAGGAIESTEEPSHGQAGSFARPILPLNLKSAESVIEWTMHAIASRDTSVFENLVWGRGTQFAPLGVGAPFPGYDNDLEIIEALDNALEISAPTCLTYTHGGYFGGTGGNYDLIKVVFEGLMLDPSLPGVTPDHRAVMFFFTQQDMRADFELGFIIPLYDRDLEDSARGWACPQYGESSGRLVLPPISRFQAGNEPLLAQYVEYATLSGNAGAWETILSTRISAQEATSEAARLSEIMLRSDPFCVLLDANGTDYYFGGIYFDDNNPQATVVIDFGGWSPAIGDWPYAGIRIAEEHPYEGDLTQPGCCYRTGAPDCWPEFDGMEGGGPTGQ